MQENYLAAEATGTMDKYRNFQELKRHEKEGTDYEICARKGSSGIAVMAPHGGGIEPGTMDMNYLKTTYGGKLCLVGNIDINTTLSSGYPEEVDREVKEGIEQLGPGGGYIISDSNSVPYFCKAENIIAMSRAVEKYRYIYEKKRRELCLIN